MQFDRGWTSVLASNGRKLLQKLEDDDEPSGGLVAAPYSMLQSAKISPAKVGRPELDDPSRLHPAGRESHDVIARRSIENRPAGPAFVSDSSVNRKPLTSLRMSSQRDVVCRQYQHLCLHCANKTECRRASQVEDIIRNENAKTSLELQISALVEKRQQLHHQRGAREFEAQQQWVQKETDRLREAVGLSSHVHQTAEPATGNALVVTVPVVGSGKATGEGAAPRPPAVAGKGKGKVKGKDTTTAGVGKGKSKTTVLTADKGKGQSADKGGGKGEKSGKSKDMVTRPEVLLDDSKGRKGMGRAALPLPPQPPPPAGDGKGQKGKDAVPLSPAPGDAGATTALAALADKSKGKGEDADKGKGKGKGKGKSKSKSKSEAAAADAALRAEGKGKGAAKFPGKGNDNGGVLAGAGVEPSNGKGKGDIGGARSAETQGKGKGKVDNAIGGSSALAGAIDVPGSRRDSDHPGEIAIAPAPHRGTRLLAEAMDGWRDYRNCSLR